MRNSHRQVTFLTHTLLVFAFSKEVYLPEGKWYDYWTGRLHTGPGRFSYTPAPPAGGELFVRGGSIIPLAPKTQFTGQRTSDGYTLQLFIESGETADFTLYEDDGISLAYEEGAYQKNAIKASFQNGAVNVTMPDTLPLKGVEIFSSSRPSEALVNNNSVQFVMHLASK